MNDAQKEPLLPSVSCREPDQLIALCEVEQGDCSLCHGSCCVTSRPSFSLTDNNLEQYVLNV